MAAMMSWDDGANTPSTQLCNRLFINVVHEMPRRTRCMLSRSGWSLNWAEWENCQRKTDDDSDSDMNRNRCAPAKQVRSHVMHIVLGMHSYAHSSPKPKNKNRRKTHQHRLSVMSAAFVPARAFVCFTFYSDWLIICEPKARKIEN